jgi:protein SCO1/2
MCDKTWIHSIALIALAGIAGRTWGAEAGTVAPQGDAAARQVIITSVDYSVPDVQLVRDDGRHVSLPAEMNDERAVVLNFIFTTCSSFCPLSSQTLSQLQDKLGTDRKRVHIMSISIDPEQDTPARLRAYAHKFGAGPGWQHYTGTLAASLAAQRAFAAYRGDKMSHSPLTLIRGAQGKTWRRIDGFATPDELLAEVRRLLAAP